VVSIGVRPADWWRGGVLYQVYVRSFADSNGDGVGDLQGLIERLDYLEWLGVRGLWLSPTTPSPDRDWGYDVSEYRSVHPDLGDLETFDRLVREAGRRGIGILLDLVPNHTSDLHPWFADSRSSRDAEHRNWYVWADPREEGSPPNNWQGVFGGSAWTLDEPTGQYYLHNFLPGQPDLNWWDERVRDEFDGILRFWLDRGVAGFRIDVAHAMVKDRLLRDNPPTTGDDHPIIRRLPLREVHNMNRPEVHDVLRRWRRVLDGYGRDRILVGETWVFGVERLVPFYGAGTDELDLAFNFPFAFSSLSAGELGTVVDATEAALPADAWPVWMGSNHDIGRFPTRWCDGDERRVRCALVLLMTLRGTPFLYYGDEIGMTDVPVPRERLRDPVGLRGWPTNPGRDPCRTPIQWRSGPGAGFTRDDVEPWLPIGDASARSVEAQQSDPASTLGLTRSLIALRTSDADAFAAPYERLSRDAGVWVWRRGDLTVGVNLSAEPGRLDLPGLEVVLGSDPARERERLPRSPAIGPWEALILRAT
jgi:alpha-glucosidase